MTTEVVRIDPKSPDPLVIQRAAAVIRAGGLVAFPTETVYGLGADALNEQAVRRIFLAKERPADNPLIVHVADGAGARRLVADWPALAQRLAEHFWPGPLTLVLPRAADVPASVTAGGPTVAVRAPAHPVALALLRCAGRPVAAPSANRSSRISPTRAEHVWKELAGRIELILDAGPTPGGLESTVLDLCTSPPRILRPGPVTPAQIEALVGPVIEPPRPGAPAAAIGTPPRSPGVHGRHYAPRTPLECVEEAAWERAAALATAGRRVGLLALGPGLEPPPGGLIVWSMPPEPHAYAQRLYAALHDLDERGLEAIVVQLPPDEPQWVAVRDRLLRAAGISTTPDAGRSGDGARPGEAGFNSRVPG